jgi:squalene-hopene/tetraprenyl-beta-curcumene cyclase
MKAGRRIAIVIAMLMLGMSTVAIGGAQDKKDPAKEQPKEQPKGKGRFKQKSWDEVTDAGIAYLKTTQAEDGTWSKASHPGITAVVITGLLKTGKVKADDPMITKGLGFIETFVDEKDGSIAAGDNIRHKFYVTSVNLQALKLADAKKYEAIISKGVAYFKKGQVGADGTKKEDDANYGGFGYNPTTRADLSNTHFALDSLTLAGVPKSDPVYKRAIVFVSRCQNLQSEHNKLPWSGKINDGSFVYVNGSGFGTAPADAAKPGYGSMTYSGLKSLALCGVSKDDDRVKKGMEWVSKNYSVDINPGRAEGAGGQGYYYYLNAMAKCFDAMGINEVTDTNGKKHDWRADMTRALTFRQKKDGSWGNDFTNWMEGDPNLDTAFALIALSYTKPKAK